VTISSEWQVERDRDSSNAVLFSAIKKLATIGQSAGFTIDEMIAMLNAGLSIPDLLSIFADCLSLEKYPHGRPQRHS
jgi:hypothetical protein